ncbi:MAG TPA: S8 family serine peptidase [Thermoanaerobaculia bacterium]
MRKLLAIVVVIAGAVPAFAQSKTTRYLISMRRPARMSGVRLLRDSAEAAAHDVRTFDNIDFAAATLTDAEAAELRKASDVRFLSPVVPRYIETVSQPVPSRLKLRAEPQSRHSASQTVAYGIDLVHARDVWHVTRGDLGVNVAIVDTGIDYTHPDLKERYAGGFNFFTGTNDPKDDHGHGTHVAGIIGATDNNFGVVGVAPSAHIWSVKVLDATGAGTDESVIGGMDWVINKKHEQGGNWIVNLSIGAAFPSDGEREIFARAIDENILVVAAAGNRGERVIDYPAAYSRVVAVSALDEDSNLASFSSFGRGVVFAAPGVDVLSTFIVGARKVAEVDQGESILPSAMPLEGSSIGEVTGDTVFCGLGKPEEIPPTVKGKIALISRGELYFRDKVKNVIAAGAIGVVIVPAEDDPRRSNWTLFVVDADTKSTFLVAISVAAKDGQKLIDDAGKTPITVSYANDDYVFLSGTSMATPHVVGSAALAWSLAPDATAEQIRTAMKLSAFDLGAKAYDEDFGYGRVDALASAKYVAPQMFGLPPTPAPVPTRRRPSSPHN